MDCKLRNGHRSIRQIADAFDVVIADGRPADPKELAQLRWRLIKEILQHLALEEQIALTPLSRDTRPEAVLAAKRFRDELSSLNQQFNAHVARWNGHVDEREWPEYRTAVRRVLATIRSRLLREELELLPLLPAQPGQEPETEPARNWLEEAPHFRALLSGENVVRPDSLTSARSDIWHPHQWVRTVQ